MVTLKRYNLLIKSMSYLNIPGSANLTGIISEPQNIMLKDAKGRAGMARIYQNGNLKNQFRVRGKGWLQMVKDNTLKNGDVCKFKFIVSKTKDHVLCLLSKNNLI
ncbi:hypothetical protein ZOSMA_205G00230 [Zostera marina]|uniref:TF-B3 domain-containing protein n=1 Tax=Zostera marina TaxID=29655 RepID=A0A0K9PNP1_ZOSMR|nr:hypothetical protein ZOSMA_205G00230 [Zostera marina]